MELVVFASFVGIQFAAKQLPEWMGHLPRCKAITAKVARNHYLVWLGHPELLHAVHDYVVHFVIYSGYVLRAH